MAGDNGGIVWEDYESWDAEIVIFFDSDSGWTGGTGCRVGRTPRRQAWCIRVGSARHGAMPGRGYARSEWPSRLKVATVPAVAPREPGRTWARPRSVGPP